jgi:hypothetical protein
MCVFLSVIATLFLQTLLFKTATSSSSIRTLAKINWDISGQNILNKGCKYDVNGKCTGFCPLTLKRCEELVNFDSNVCGCGYCSFNTTTKKCNGQCGNLILDSCVSKVEIPTKDSDCLCASCKSGWETVGGDPANPDYQVTPSCDQTTCFGNSCEPVFVSFNGRTRANETLYCSCSNFFIMA